MIRLSAGGTALFGAACAAAPPFAAAPQEEKDRHHQGGKDGENDNIGRRHSIPFCQEKSHPKKSWPN